LIVLHSAEHYNLFSASAVRVIKSSRMSWVEHVTFMEETKNTHTILDEIVSFERPRHRRGIFLSKRKRA
jgi:hypothetical protein